MRWRYGLWLLLVSCAVNAQVPQRLLVRDMARYLELGADQLQSLSRLDTEWSAHLAQRAERARLVEAALAQASAARAPDRRRIDEQTRELEALCVQTHERQAELMRQARLLLNGDQLTKLAALEQAFALMPIIQSAQAAHLLAPTLSVAPAGMPDGTVFAEVAFQRAAPALLPGCRPQASRVLREVESSDPAQPVRGPGR